MTQTCHPQPLPLLSDVVIANESEQVSRAVARNQFEGPVIGKAEPRLFRFRSKTEVKRIE